jgi:hypothetical protein
MKIVGCDLHARQKTIAMVDTETGEFTEKTLDHEGNAVRAFYAALETKSSAAVESRGRVGKPMRGCLITTVVLRCSDRVN